LDEDLDARDDDRSSSPDGESALDLFTDELAMVKASYPDLAEVDVDALFIAFLLQSARFGVFTFGPITIDVRTVEERYAKTYRRLDPDHPIAGMGASAKRFYVQLSQEAARSGARRLDELHFLLAFMRTSEGLPRQVFAELAIAPEEVESYGRGAGPRPETPERLYSPEEAAAYLGVHPQTVRVWIREGKLPARRILGQRALRIRQSDLTAVLEPLDGDDI